MEESVDLCAAAQLLRAHLLATATLDRLLEIRRKLLHHSTTLQQLLNIFIRKSNRLAENSREVT